MSQLNRPTFIVGNWKMYKTIGEGKAFIKGLASTCAHSSRQIGLAVPFTMISAAVEAAKNSPIAIGAQNVYDAEEGAFTGEISCRMLKDAGSSFVIIGHSERRLLFLEDDQWINRKLKRVLSEKLKAIVCIGETLEQYQQGTTHSVLSSQLKASLHDIGSEQFESVVLAYEPVWAIGTGRTATPEIAQKVHLFCREVVAKIWGSSIAERLIIQYGGSVKPDNAAELLAQPDVDGLLVGGASLSLDAFSKIIQCV